MIGPGRTRQTLLATLLLASVSGFPLAARAQGADDAPPPAVTPAPEPPPPGYGPPPATPVYPPPATAAAGLPARLSAAGVHPGARARDARGLYLRLHLGGGFTSVSASDGVGDKVTVSGGSVSLGVAVGGAVAPNLALFGTVFASVATQPNVTESGYGSGTANGNISVGGFGAGVVYYFEPFNLYLSGAIAAVNLQGQDSNGNTTGQTKIGPGFQAMVGKEWWVSTHWGLGVAGELIAATMKDKDNSNVTWDAGAFSILFSATCF